MRTIHIPQVTTKQDDGRLGSFTIEPLHRGYGITLGNSLRRVLLSSLEGSAVTGFKIPKVSHEFAAIKGVKEDMVQVTLNLKRLRFRLFTTDPQTLTINKKGKGKVTGADIQTTADVEVINPEQVIATLDSAKDALEMELRVERGRGYLPVEERVDEGEVGMVAVDALFSPVQRVRYKVGRTRVGQVTGLDSLEVEIATDGSISPTETLRQAAAIMIEQLAVIAGEERASQATGAAVSDSGEEQPDELNFSVEDLNLTPRTTNALLNNQINTVRDLIGLSDNDLKNLKGFGSKAFNEVLDKLKELELR